MTAPRNGMGDRNGPRFTIGWVDGINCGWSALIDGITIVDNHNGYALGRAYAVVPNKETAEEIVTLLNEAWNKEECARMMEPTRSRDLFVVLGVITVVIFLALFLGGCKSPSLQSTVSQNKEITVDLITQFDGIRLYRVNVDGRSVYVAATGTVPVETSWIETHYYSCGKATCTKKIPYEVIGVR